MLAPMERQVRVARTTQERLRAELLAMFGRPPCPRSGAARTQVISHYELLEELGVGAKGTVYLARDQVLLRCVAIKILPLGADAETRRRFLSEARCGALFNHPNIVAVYELLKHHGMDLIVMEHVAGRTLDRVIPRHGLPLGTFLAYALQIAEAVGAIHATRMVHRDLKPANFVVKRNGAVKLLDFGLAKVLNDRGAGRSGGRKPKQPETPEGTILGTPGYMAPEQVRGEAADARSDVFSLGAVFYEMLTGRRAFREATPIETMIAILRKPPRKLPAHIPLPIARIVRRCLAKDPSRRYRTAKELAANLLSAETDRAE